MFDLRITFTHQRVNAFALHSQNAGCFRCSLPKRDGRVVDSCPRLVGSRALARRRGPSFVTSQIIATLTHGFTVAMTLLAWKARISGGAIWTCAGIDLCRQRNKTDGSNHALKTYQQQRRTSSTMEVSRGTHGITFEVIRAQETTCRTQCWR